MTSITVPLQLLQVSPLNVRTNTEDANETASLEASILAHGLLLPLVVHPIETGQFGVLAGGRRLHALQQLQARGALPADHPVDVVVRDMTPAEIHEASLAENLLRRDLRPYEVYAAYAKANRDGATVEQLAERFGQRVVYVRQVLRLGNLAPEIFAALASGQISVEQAQAYAATEDHDLQRAVWKILRGQPAYNHQPHSIRAKLGVADRDHGKILAFVGLAAYEAAGGRFERDIFQPDDVGRVSDPEILAKVHHAKMERIRAEISAVVSRPVTFQPDPPKTSGVYPATDNILQVFPNRARLTNEAKARREAVEARITELLEESKAHIDGNVILAGHEADIDRINAELNPLQDELDAIDASRRVILPKLGDIVVTIHVRDGGQYEVSYWFANRTQKRLGDGAAAPTTETSGKFQPGVAMDDRASPGETKRANAIAKDQLGLSQDGVEIARSLRRALMRAMLIEDSQAAEPEDVGIDYLVWSQLRAILDGYNSRAGRVGARTISGVGGLDANGDPSIAEPQLKEMRAHQIWTEALATLRAQTFITADNIGGAFIDFQHAPREIKRLAAAVVAGYSLQRTMNADGYRLDIHDVVANATNRSYPAAIRKLWHPTAAFLDLLPRLRRLEAVQPMVDAPTFKGWGKAKAAELTDMVLRVLTGRSPSLKAKGVSAAAEWVHPALQFGRPNVLDHAAPADREAA